MSDNIHEHRRQIEKAINKNGQFSHNIVSIVLREVSKEFGVNVANGLVDEYELDELYGIQKVNQ